MELTRLRLWLAVAMGEDEARPLPDLDVNICVGDSLDLPRASRGTAGVQLGLPYEERQRLANDLERLMARYARGIDDPDEMRAARHDIAAVRRKLAGLASPGDEGRAGTPPFSWDTFFAHIFRGESRGFDVVIANPPYVRFQELDAAHRSRYQEA